MTRRLLLTFLIVEVLLFLLPTTGKVEGLALSYWDGVRLRLTNANYLARAVLSGIGGSILFEALVLFAAYFARFVKPPSDG